jgi:putative DNA primase/helicase
LNLVPASEIQLQELQWLWPGRIPVGLVTMIAGDPKTGKSLVACRIAATVTRGANFPCGEGTARRGHVVIIECEDDAKTILRPRLAAARADQTRVHIPTRNLDRTNFVGELKHMLRRVPHLRAVILDPITALIPTSRNNADQVRTVLSALGGLASDLQIAVIIVCHLNKSRSGTAVSRISGSFEWMAACRAGFLVVNGAEKGQNLFLPLPSNIGLKPEGLAFRVIEVEIEDGQRAPRIRWGETVSVSADEALARMSHRDSATTSEAIEFLRQTVTKPMLAKTVLRFGKEAGFSPKELRTAREKLGIRTKRVGGVAAEGRWAWFPRNTKMPKVPAGN